MVVTSIFFNSSDVGRPICCGKKMDGVQRGGIISTAYLLLVVKLTTFEGEWLNDVKNEVSYHHLLNHSSAQKFN